MQASEALWRGGIRHPTVAGGDIHGVYAAEVPTSCYLGACVISNCNLGSGYYGPGLNIAIETCARFHTTAWTALGTNSHDRW